jgi:hypothetical protein
MDHEETTMTEKTNQSKTAKRIHAKEIAESKKRAHRTRGLEAPKHGGGQRELAQRTFYGEERFAGMLTLAEGVRRQIKHVPAEGEKPAYDHVKHMNVDIHLRDGVKPDEKGEIHGMIEVKVREIKPRRESDGDKINYYLYINVFPLRDGAKAKKIVTLTRFCRDESAFDTVYVPHAGQKVEQASICVGPLPEAPTAGATASPAV